MARYTKVLKSLAHNAVGSRRIEAVAPAGANYYVTGATLEDGDDYTLTLSRNGGLGDVTVDMLPLVTAGTKFLSSMSYSPSTYKVTGTMSDASIVVLTDSLRVFGNDIVLSGSNQGAINLHENSANGNAYVSLRAPADMGTDPSYILTLPTTDGDSGQYLISNGSGVLSWATPTDANYYVTGGTYSAGDIEFSGTTSFPNFTVTGLPTGTIGGSITDNQVAFGATTANSIEGSANFTFDGTDLKIVGGTDNANIYLETPGAGNTSTLFFGDAAASNAGYIKYDNNNQRMQFGVEASTKGTWTANGLGIGTTAPTQALDVRGNIVVTDNNKIMAGSGEDLRFFHDGTDSIIQSVEGDFYLKNTTTDKDIIFITDTGGTDTETMRIDGSTQRVGIGTTAPEQKLDVRGNMQLKTTSNTNVAYIGDANRSGADSSITAFQGFWDGTKVADMLIVSGDDTTNKDNGEFVFRTATAGTVAERLRITDDGNVGIGTSAPETQLHITGDMTVEGSDILFGTTDKVKFKRGGSNYFQMLTSGNSAAGLQSLGLLVSNSYGSTPQRGTVTLQEITSAPTEAEGYGFLWVSGSVPNKLYYTDDDGTDFDLTLASTATGTIGGSITDNQVAFGATTANSIEGSANFTFDGTDAFLDTSGGGKLKLGAATEYIQGSGSDIRIYASDNVLIAPTDDLNIRADDVTIETTAAAEYVRFDGGEQRVGIGTTSAINSSKVSIVDTAKPLTLAYDGSNYATFKVSSGGALTIDTGNDINLDSYTGITNYLYRGTEKFRITAGASSPVIFQPKADAYDMAFNQYDGNEVMRITDGGAVGIGTDAPSQKFEVNGGGTSTYMKIVGQNNTGYIGQDSVGMAIYQEANASMYFATNNTTRMTLTNGGNLGIGTGSPNVELDVAGDVRVRTGYKLYFGDTDTSEYIRFGSDDLQLHSGDDISLNTVDDVAFNAADVKFQDTAGNTHLTVSETGTNGAVLESPSSMYLISNDNLHLQADDAIQFLPDEADQTGGPVQVFNYRGGTEYVRFDGANQRLGIGTTSPSKELHVVGNSLFNGSLITEEFIQVDKDGTPGILIGEGGDADIYYDATDLNINAARVGSGILKIATDTTIDGTLSATAKSFNIEHPLYKDKRLVHGSLEGPEHGIYIRGSIESKEYGCLIELPEYWGAMCEDYTVQLTPHGPYTVYIKEKQKDKVMIACTSKDYKFDYYVVGSRTDETLEVVQDG